MASLVFAVLAAGCGASSDGRANGPTGNATGQAGTTGTGAPTGSGTGAAGSGATSAGTAGTNGGGAGAGTGFGGGGPGTGAGGSSGPYDAGASDGGVDAPGAAGTTGAAGTGGAAGTTGAAGAGPPLDGGVACTVHIDAVNPASTANLEYGPASVLTVRAWVAGYPFPPKWSWFIRSAAGRVNWTSTNDAGDEVDIKLQFAGRYLIQAFIEGAPQCNSQTQPIDVGPPRTPSFLFRVTPPSGLRLPTQESVLEAPKVATEPHSIDLGGADPANVVSLSPSDTRGFPLPSYVRISGLSFGFGIDGYTGYGPLVASLAPGPVYNVLIVPDGGLAPLLVSSDKLDVLGQKMMAIPVGVPVSGQAHDVHGQPVAGARVLLRAGDRPSTLGVTGVDGRFSASTREGTMSAVIAPPPGSGLPEAHVASSPGIMLLANSTDLTLAMTWADPRAASLTVTVRATDGTTVVAGAQVRAESTSEIGMVGSLHVVAPPLPPVDLLASGTARADAVSDAAGVANLGLLPAGSYRVTIAPPGAAASAATTTLTVVLPETGLSRDVALLPLVAVSGTLMPTAQSAGARVTAIDNGVLAPPSRAVTVADGNGKYSLMLSPGRTYELLVEPGAGTGLARDVVDRFTPGSVPTPRDVAVPVALLWKGTVSGGSRPVAGALVQVFCVASSPTCFDSSIAVAQGVTRIDGTLELALPSP